jgi:hypothetical protein
MFTYSLLSLALLAHQAVGAAQVTTPHLVNSIGNFNHSSTNFSKRIDSVKSYEAVRYQKKRGIPYNDINKAKKFVFSGSKVDWAYNWDQKSNGNLAGLKFVPMLWGGGDSRVKT